LRLSRPAITAGYVALGLGLALAGMRRAAQQRHLGPPAT
jgi:hypothetical protein